MLPKAERYASLALSYLENAAEELSKGELEKASEYIWGAAAEAIKCVLAARKGIIVTRHAELRKYARELARETGDPDIFRAFREAESLHSNFYEAVLEKEDLLAHFE
ncbi:hypothetical protein DRO32_04395, partial [Candidatus Bathyarchaeota archaeon]